MIPPPAKLQVFFDGVCPLCSREAALYKKRDRDGRIEWVDIAHSQFDAQHFGLNPDAVQKVMHARTPDGRVVTQVAAFIEIWKALPRTWFTRFLLALLRVPGMMPIAGILYRLFARNRYRLTGRCTAESCQVPPTNR